jgi:phospholipid transport system substrate-binding protein
MKNKALMFFMIFVALSLRITPAHAESPTDYVRGIMDKVMAIQKDQALAGPAHEAERGRLIHQIIEKNFDFPLMAQTSLGAHYGHLSAAQRQEFTTTFSYLFQDSYTRMVLNFLKQEAINYHRERQEDGKAQVDTTLIRRNEAIPVNYLMHRRGSAWVLYDVTVDGVSILENYKTQFARVIQTESFAALLNKMKTQERAIK